MQNPALSILSNDGTVRGFIINSRELVQNAFELHQTAPVVTAALGRLLSAAVMMGKTLKNPGDLITLQIEGEGPVKTLLATAGANGNVKGYAGNPLVDIPLKSNGKLDVSGAVGPGFLTVLRDNGTGEPYVSRTALVSGEIAEDITGYYAQSEQTPSICALGVLVDRDYTVKSSGGFLIQLMPGAEEATICRLEENLQKFQNVSALFEYTSNEEIAQMLMDQIPFHITEQWNAAYYCNCSKKRTEKVLLSLGRQELMQLIQEQKPVELCCHFCNRKYQFSRKELEVLLIEGAEK